MTIFYKPRARKYVKGNGFLSFDRKCRKQFLNTGVDVLITTSKTVVHKAVDFLGKKIADAISQSNDDKIVKSETVEEVIIPPEKREEILKE